MSMRHSLITITLLLLVFTTASAQSGPQITQSVVAGGGGTSATAPLQVEGTVGQSVTGTSTGGTYTLESGFWPGAAALTTSTLTVDDVTGTYGGAVVVTATLSANGVNLPGKLVTFSLNGNVVGTANTDVNGLASLAGVSLAGINAGNYPGAVGASFAGDSSFTASNGTGALTVNQANQTINVNTHAPTSAAFNSQFTVAATSDSTLAVSYSSSGACTNIGATFTMTSGTGTCTVKYDQAGNSNYNAAAQVTEFVTAQKVNQAITFGALSSKTYGDAPFTVSATGGNSGNAVTFTSTTPTVCTVSGNTVTILSAGDCTIRASQAGNDNYNAASDVDQSFTVAKAASTTTVTVSNATYDGNPHGGTASVTGAGGLNQSLTITYTGRNATVYSSTTAPTNAGDYTAGASFAGDANHNSSSDSKDFSIVKANQTITFGVLSTKTFGDPDFAVSATASSTLAVTFAATGQCTVTADGSAVHITGAGSCTITASQGGNANYNAATDVAQTFQIAKADQTITFGSLSGKTYGDSNFTVSATGGASGNAVTFTSTTSAVCTVSGNTVTILSAGTCTIRASQAGNDNYNAASDVDQSFMVAKAATSTALSSSANPSSTGQSVTFTATVTSAAGTPTGTVTFKDGVSAIIGCSNIALSSGQATCSTSTLTTGSHTITAEYSGDANFSSSTGTLSGGQQVNIQTSLSINDVQVQEGNTGTANVVFTVTLAQTSNLAVTVNYQTANDSATNPSDYQSTSGTLTFSPGDLTKTVTVLINGDTVNEGDEIFLVNLSGAVNATISDTQGKGTILNDDTTLLQFSASNYTIGEAAGHATITVTRTGDLSQATSVDYTTSDLSALNDCNVVTGNASQRCDYTGMAGTLSFIAGQQTATFDIPIINDVYVEGAETLSVTLSNPAGGTLGAQATSSVTITDDDLASGAPNPIDTTGFFIRQHYLDFLNREPEEPAYTQWQNILNNCAAGDKNCDDVGVSIGFFRSRELFERAYYVYRFYETALGRHPSYAEYQQDIRRVTGFLTEAELEARKAEFAEEFVQRQEFRNLYDGRADGAEYVNAIIATAGVTPSNSADVANRQGAHLITRGRALRELVESPEIGQHCYNRGFVVVGYFAYLRRDPDALYLEWVEKLNNPPAGQTFEDTYREMIRGFIESLEYGRRFGQ